MSNNEKMDNRTLIEQYYRDHRDELLAYVSSRLGGDVCLAEDMVQELFLRLLADERRLIAEETLASLTYTMASNLVADHYRRLFYQRTYVAHVYAVLSSYYDIEPVVYVHDTLRHIERRLSKLPQACAEIYRLHLYGGMKVAEISQRLGLDYKAVEYRLGQARREVRHLLRRSV